MTYEFRDMFDRSPTTTTVPSDAVVLLDFGKAIDELITRFQTVNVSGRGVATKKIETADTSRAGVQYLSDKLNKKELILTGFLKCNTPAELNAQLSELNRILNQGELKFSFADQRDVYMTGVFDVRKVEAGTLRPRVEIGITCSDPALYALETTKLNFGEALSKSFGMLDFFNQGWRPTKVHIEYDQKSDVTANGAIISVKSTDSDRNGRTLRTIPYTEVRTGTSVAEFLLNEEGGRLAINGYYADQYINIESDLVGFVLKEGDSIVCDNQITAGYAEFTRKEVG